MRCDEGRVRAQGGSEEMNHFYESISYGEYPCKGIFDYADLCAEIVKLFPSGSHFAEVGAFLGKSSACMAVEILNSGKDIRFDVVDSWEGEGQGAKQYFDPRKREIEQAGSTLYREFIFGVCRTPALWRIVKPVKLRSAVAAQLYAPRSIDFLFLDADHRYEEVVNDLAAWTPKIKRDGIISGHDYHHTEVMWAVNERFGNGTVRVWNTPDTGRRQARKCWIHDPTGRMQHVTREGCHSHTDTEPP